MSSASLSLSLFAHFYLNIFIENVFIVVFLYIITVFLLIEFFQSFGTNIGVFVFQEFRLRHASFFFSAPNLKRHASRAGLVDLTSKQYVLIYFSLFFPFFPSFFLPSSSSLFPPPSSHPLPPSSPTVLLRYSLISIHISQVV